MSITQLSVALRLDVSTLNRQTLRCDAGWTVRTPVGARSARTQRDALGVEEQSAG